MKFGRKVCCEEDPRGYKGILNEWAKIWQMGHNVGKCQTIHFDRENIISNYKVVVSTGLKYLVSLFKEEC